MKNDEFTERLHRVTAKPRSVLMLLLEGKTDEEIAKAVNISMPTVRKHIQNLCDRFELPSEVNSIKRNRREDLIALFAQYKAELVNQGATLTTNQAVVAANKQLDEESSKQHQDWDGAPDVSVFYGRTEQLTKLKQWIIEERCRLVALLGMGGIGKTALSVRCGQEIQSEFEYIIWRSLRKEPPPPLKELLADLIHFLSGQQKLDLPADDDRRVSQLLQYLQQHRCLLVLDNLETILEKGELAGTYTEEHKNYGEFLRRVGEERHNSCLLLTSRDKPREISLMEGESSPVRSLPLNGLKQLEAQNILQEKGLSGEEKWGKLIEIYQGNPLALKIISSRIKDLAQGNVIEFFKQGLSLLSIDFEIFIEHEFRRLSSNEMKIVYQLTIENEPATITSLHNSLFLQMSFDELQNAIQSLLRRSLIETITDGFVLQRVVSEYVNKRLVEELFAEINELENHKKINNIKILKIYDLKPTKKQSCDKEFETSSILNALKKRLPKSFINKNDFVEQLNRVLPVLQTNSTHNLGYAAQNIEYLICELQ